MVTLRDWLFPRIPNPQLLPQIEAWTDNGHLYDVAYNLGIDPTAFPLDRAGAMRVPAVARARNLTCGAIAGLPLKALRGAAVVDPQPYWAYGTDGQLGDLSRPQLTAWGLAPQTPWHRMLWTIDDLYFHEASLWLVSLFTEKSTGPTRPLRMLRVPYDHWQVNDAGVLCDLDAEPFPTDRVVYIPGPNEGILDYGRDTIRTAFDLERNAADVAARPFRLELHQTSDAVLTPTERSELVGEVRTALASNDGILFTNKAIETIEHRMDSDALQLGARNTSALDVARVGNMPALMIDATAQGASLEYQTIEGRNQQWLDYGLSLYLDAVESRLSMDDVLPAGQRTAFDTADWTGPAANPTGPPTED
jgi:hypothetical protein